ncbi:MAG: hypothetical protein AB9Q22_11970 [Candidatus Reddybacter sp.]
MTDSEAITGTANIVLEGATVSAKLRQKSAFAIQHLIAAARFSRQCGEIQKQNEGKALGSFYDEQISCVSAAIMLCVASIESNINELLSMPETLFPEADPNIQKEVSSLIGELSIIDKYQRILLAKGITAFDKGSQPLQDIEVLISLRNELVHFHPEWHDEQQRHEKLGRKLRGKFELSPFITESTGVLFPQRIVSHGCTKWAVEKSIEFMTQFNSKLGLHDKFSDFQERLNP